MLSTTHFKFCPWCGNRAISVFEKNGMQCAACGYVYFHNCASAVTAIIETKRGIIFTKRNHAPKKGLLDLPGGFCDYHESLEDALRREIREELALDLASVSYYGSFPNVYRFKGVTYFTVDSVFICRARTLSSLAPNPEIAAVLFAKPSSIDMKRVAFDSTRRAIRAYAGASKKQPPRGLNKAADPRPSLRVNKYRFAADRFKSRKDRDRVRESRAVEALLRCTQQNAATVKRR